MTRPPRPPSPTLLHHYLSDLHVNWYLIRNHLTDRPEEAASRNNHGASALFKALYRRVEDYPSPVIVDLLLNAYPPAMWDNDPDHCPLRAACWRRASLPIQERLLRSRPSRPSDIHALHALWKSYDTLFGDDLLPTILQGGREGAEIWRKLYALLEYCTHHTMDSYQNLHALAAATPSCPPELIRLSVSYFPQQIRQPDQRGKLPLHHFVTRPRPTSPNPDHSETASRRSPADPTLEVLQLLLSWYPEAANLRDTAHWQLPLHGAIAQGYPWKWIQPLVGASTDALSQVDGVTLLYPFQLAACTNACSLTLVFELIRAAPYLLKDGIPPTEDEGNPTVMHTRSLIMMQQHKSSSSSVVASCDVVDQQDDYHSMERIMQQASRRDDPDMWSDVQRLLAYRTPADQWYAVHAAASLPDCPLGLLELTVIMQRQELALRNTDGDLPLHLVVRHSRSGDNDEDYDTDDDDDMEDARTTRIRILLHDYPQAASLRDSHGRLPLHMAVSAGQPWTSLNALIHAYPAAVGERNNCGLYPFQEAAVTDMVGLTEVYELLLAAPHLLAEGVTWEASSD